MKKVTLLLLLFYLAACDISQAQAYDSDSVYYTKIQMPRHVRRQSVFKDTVRHIPFVKYYFLVASGVSMGCKDCDTGNEFTYSISSIHGVYLGRKLAIGGGIGFDAYNTWQTMPLFGNISYDLIGTRNTHALFIQAQYGGAYARHDKLPQDYNLKDTKGGSFTAAQVGYRIKYHDLKIALMLGYKRQYVSTYFEYPNWRLDENGRYVETDPNTLAVKRRMERFTMSIAIGWK